MYIFNPSDLAKAANNSLLFIPDISGFTKFVQSTEIEHSRHVIAELLEILIEANNDAFELAEIEGDALFFYKEGEVPSRDKLLDIADRMFVAFYSHLKVMERHRICPCNACATAPNLDLKIIAHSGELHFISVLNNRKPFGTKVIEAHRLLKNSVKADNYLLLSDSLMQDLKLDGEFKDGRFTFEPGTDTYDDNPLNYGYALLDKDQLNLKPFAQVKSYDFKRPPNLRIERDFPVSAEQLFEYVSNFSYRHHLMEEGQHIKFNENAVNRVGSKHVCVIDGNDIDFVTVTKAGEPGQLVYGELTTTPPIVDQLFAFDIITPVTDDSCHLVMEWYWTARSPIKKLMIALVAKKAFMKNQRDTLDKLTVFVNSTLE